MVSHEKLLNYISRSSKAVFGSMSQISMETSSQKATFLKHEEEVKERLRENSYKNVIKTRTNRSWSVLKNLKKKNIVIFLFYKCIFKMNILADIR